MGTAQRTRRGRVDRFATASHAFLLPIMAIFVVLFAVPLAQTFYYSLTNYQGFSPTYNFVGLANYTRVVHDSALLQALSFTILFAVATTTIITCTAIPLAVAFNKRFMGRNLVRSLFFFLGVPSQAILGLVWQFIFSPLPNGALNSLVTKLGASSIPWLVDENIAKWCVILVAVWAGVGWHATLYLAYLQAIPAELYESAQVDGANGRQQFFHITVPQLLPAIVVSTFLLITGGLKVYDLPFAMTKGGPGFATNTVTQSIIVQGISQGNIGLGSALAMIFTVASLVIVFAQMMIVRVVSRRFE